ncbi:MAG: hypothetical protein ABJP70_06190 [Erythrobacter sp.]
MSLLVREVPPPGKKSSPTRLPPELRRVVDEDELEEERELLFRDVLLRELLLRDVLREDVLRVGVVVRRVGVLAGVVGAGLGSTGGASSTSGRGAKSGEGALGSPNSGATDARLSKTTSGPAVSSPTSVAKLTVRPWGSTSSSSLMGIGKLAKYTSMAPSAACSTIAVAIPA